MKSPYVSQWLKLFTKRASQRPEASTDRAIGTLALSGFEEYIYNRFEASIRSWEGQASGGIYAMSFFIYDEEDDPRRPTVTLGYNTTERWDICTPKAADGSDIGWPVASDEQEAKWNYAFWLQNEEVVIGRSDSPADPEGIRLRSDWIKAQGLSYSDEDEDADFDACMVRGEEITRNFVELCVRVARQLHEQGVIEARFGRSVPILVHELEYYDEIADQTRRANPPGLTGEFEDWIKGP
jgi:hypothetical protein